MHELAVDEHVVDELAEVARDPRANGAPNDAFGRCTISLRQPCLGRRLSATFPWRPRTLSEPGSENAARTTSTSTNGTRTSVDAAMLARSVYARLRPGRNSRVSARHIRLTWSASVVSS